MSITEHRIVHVDNHIIAQFNDFTGPTRTASWYTCSKANNNDEGDFAVWSLSQVNLAKAHKLINGEYKLLEAPSNYYAKQHNDSKWYIHRSDEIDLQQAHDSQNMALRALARSL